MWNSCSREMEEGTRKEKEAQRRAVKVTDISNLLQKHLGEYGYTIRENCQFDSDFGESREVDVMKNYDDKWFSVRLNSDHTCRIIAANSEEYLFGNYILNDSLTEGELLYWVGRFRYIRMKSNEDHEKERDGLIAKTGEDEEEKWATYLLVVFIGVCGFLLLLMVTV